METYGDHGYKQCAILFHHLQSMKASRICTQLRHEVTIRSSHDTAATVSARLRKQRSDKIETDVCLDTLWV